MDKHLLTSIDPAVIGERLADARRARGLTQQQAAEMIGVARTTITAMEKGERRPRAGELVRLAQHYGRQVQEFVRAEAAVPQPDFVVQFRTQSAVDNAEPDVRQFQRFCEWYVELENMLGAPLPQHYPAVYDTSGSSPERAAEEVAASERNRLGLGDGPIDDVWGLLESDIGLRVFAFPMSSSSIAGMFNYTPEYGGCIAVNANQPVERQRWSATHEYAHFLTDRYKPEISVLRDQRRKPESERFADAFAVNFLMPAAGLTRRFTAMRRARSSPITPADLLALSHRYGVSAKAMTLRLEDLQLLPPSTWDRLEDMGFKPHRARKLVPLSPRADLAPTRYVLLAAQALAEAKLSESELARRLGTDIVSARARVQELSSEATLTDDGDWRQASFDLTAALTSAS
jgi:Zn-dependent peptidase ImmA (M78 family)/DNA-binding XRE family transcriptional regulator